MTGVAPYLSFKGQDGIAPVSVAIEHMGSVDANGVFQPAYPWLNKAISLAILAGYSSVILVMLLGQSRVFYSMSKDKLLPAAFSKVHPKYRTPVNSNLLFLVLVSAFAAFVPARVAGEMTSIGTLLAFIIVCTGILVMRKTMPEAPRGFRTPLVPLIPILGILTCLFMMVFLPFDTWIRLIVWMVIGLDIYTWYGRKNASKSKEVFRTRENNILNLSSIALSTILIVISLWHQYAIGFNQDLTLAGFAITLGTIHIIIFGYRLIKKI